MLPKFLVGSYRRYKADTTRFSTWLVETAASCGTSIDGIAANNDGGNTQKIPLRSYSTLVNAIVEAGISLPKSVGAVVERAISLRKHCAKVIQAARPGSKESNAGHSHFITVLEDALRCLSSSNNPSSKEQINKTMTEEGPHALTTAEDEYTNVSNRFAALAVDDDLADDVETMSVVETKRATKTVSV